MPYRAHAIIIIFGLTVHLLHARPRAEIVADLLDLFPKAAVTNSSSCELRRPAAAGGVKQDALFEHPMPRKAARVEYKVALPAIGTDELLLFSFETALADGITASPGVDGVRFSVELEGKEVFGESCREMRWTPQTIDLAPFAGKDIRLVLVTHEVGNTSYDWAVWGSPRIIRIAETSTKLEGTRGVVLKRIPGRENAWEAKQFNHDVTWESPDPAMVVAAPFPANLQIVKLGATEAAVPAGQSTIIRAEVKNAGYGSQPKGEAQIELHGVGARAVPALSPGAVWIAEWELPKAQSMELHARVGTNILKSRLEVSRPITTNSVQNEQIKIDFVREPDGYAFARIFGRQDKDWREVARWAPLMGIDNWSVRPLAPASHSKSSIEFVQPALDHAGVEVEVRLRVTLERDRPLVRIHYEWQSRKPRTSGTLWGPNIYVDGPAKSWGLFPGLEYLYGPERSSNPRDFAPPLDDRRTPDPHQITIPLMAITTGSLETPLTGGSRFFTPDSLVDHLGSVEEGPQHTVSIHWSPGGIQTRFASPNFDQNMDNHRLGLFLPAATGPLELDATLVVAKGPPLVAVREWLRDTGGLPKPNAWPRSFHEELDLCRTGFLKTVSDEKGEKFRHCIGWGASHSPGFAALLWLDSRIAKNAESRARVDLVATNMLRGSNPGALMSQANCHIMQWEFPFIYGYLPEALAHLDGFIAGLIKSQRSDGGWVYEPANKEQADLGRAGDSVLGTCANRASSLLRYARITGDQTALAAGEKALRFMEMFRVPRGGQTWECPMYEPDILAAAYAVRGYHDAYRITANRRWLTNAVYWAETGVPFIYLWSLPDKPMMLGATIPVFGSTFYTHSWLGVPVQWCGLVYAYHVFHLAEELRKTPLALTLKFSTDDWKRVVELITVSGMHQQFAEGDKIGAYPDSISRFEQRNPAFLNPEDILVNVLALKGYDPDIKTVQLKSTVISSGAKLQNARAHAKGVRFDAEWFENELSHTLISGLEPATVKLDGALLPRSSEPPRREPGWWWDEQRRRVYLTVRHAKARMLIEVN